MRALALILMLASHPVAAQVITPDDIPGGTELPPIELPETPEDDSLPEAPPLPDVVRPDYSQLTPTAEREVRLDALFARLAGADADTGALIGEEIWVIWMDSGSPSVNLLLQRGMDAQKRGQMDMARRMYNHVTALAPGNAEGWSRSARLALDEGDFESAVRDATEALIREPRHYYALWTLGTVLERLGRPLDALEAYGEVGKLYPELEAVKARREALEAQTVGTVL